MSNSTLISTTSTSAPTSISSVAAAASSSAEASASASIASSVSSQILSDTTTTVEPLTTNIVTSIVSASAAAPTTELITSVVTRTPTSAGESSLAPITVVVTTSSAPQATTPVAVGGASSTTSAAASSTSSAPASLQNDGTSNASSAGLSEAGKTAVAVVVPVVVVALLVLAGLFFWRRRKQRRNAAEARRMEVEDYGFNPNNDPTLPVVGADGRPEMAEDQSGGYRGWGNTNRSNRQGSTTISGGHTQGQLSDSGSNPGYPSSPPGGASDAHSGDPLVNNRDTMSSDDLGALGAAPVTASNRHDMRRGPSNASSSYSAGNNSDHTDSMPNSIGQAYSGEAYDGPANYSFSQAGPYGDGSYGGGASMPVVRDVSARRNTRIEQAGGYQQGNSGIAQNF